MFLRCFMFLLFIVSTQSKVKQALQKKQIQSKMGKYLRNHMYRTILNAENVQQCYSDCVKDNRKCESLNYLLKSKTCELNDINAKDAPQDYIDQYDSIYCTNVAFGKQGYSLPRYSISEEEFDVCKSNPCSGRGVCVRGKNNVTFHCTCVKGYHGKMCEQKKDPCQPNPCRNSARCISKSTGHYRCNCSAFSTGTHCENEKQFRIVMDGSKTEVTCFTGSTPHTGSFAFGFWFKTSQENAYFFTSTINEPYKFVAWKKKTTFYFQFKPDAIISFTLLPTMYSSTEFWHHVFLTVFGGYVKFFFDSIVRHDTKIYTGGFNIRGLEKICLGYHKEDDGTEHFFNGSIGQFQYYNSFPYPENGFRPIYCRCHPSPGGFAKNWISGDRLVQDDTCHDKIPFNNITAYLFQGHYGISEWMEYNISKEYYHTEFALTFWMYGNIHPGNSDYTIACFSSNNSDPCFFSVEILRTMQLRVRLGFHVSEFPLLPVFDSKGHFFVISWNNSQGELLFLLDMAVQGQVFGVFTGDTIPGATNFKMGGNGFVNHTYEGWLLEMNFWDPVPSVDYLEKMYLYPGYDIGNVVAFSNFVVGLPEHEIEKDHSWYLRTYDYMTQAKGIFLDFATNETNYLYHESTASTGYDRGFSISLWFYLKQFPALLFSNENRTLVINITDNGIVLWKLGSDVFTIGTLTKLEGYNFLAISWSRDGNLYVNFKGIVSHVSSNFSIGHIIPHDNHWYIGGVDAILFGKISNVIVWNFPIPINSLKALAHGLVGIASAENEINWQQVAYSLTKTADVRTTHDYIMVEASYSLQLTYDAHCTTAMSRCSKAYARIGVNMNGVFKWGCFCYEELNEIGMVNSDSIGDYNALDSLIGLI